MCYSKGAHLFTHRWLQLPTFGAFWFQFKIFHMLPKGSSFLYSPFGGNYPLLSAKSHLPTSLTRDEETIICGAINEKIQITVCLEHHELLYICKFDQFSLLPDQRPRKNHLRSKWHIQWEDWTLRVNTLSRVYFWQSWTEWHSCHFLLQVKNSHFVGVVLRFSGRLHNDSILIPETPQVHV